MHNGAEPVEWRHKTLPGSKEPIDGVELSPIRWFTAASDS